MVKDIDLFGYPVHLNFDEKGGGGTNSHHVMHEVAATDSLLNHIQKLCAVSWTQRLEHRIIFLIRHKNPLCLFVIVMKE